MGRQAGYSLIELLIVVVIMGILAAYVTYNINSSKTKLKSYAFDTKAQFQRAKFEAIKRSRDVYIDFDFLPSPGGDGNIDNGYTIWVDEDGDAGGGGAYEPAEDTIIETVVFQNPVMIYTNASAEEPGASDNGPNGSTVGDGVSAGSDRFKMKPNGLSSGGTGYIYSSDTPGGPIAAGPWAVIVSTVGRIRLDEWTGSGWAVD